eukprot:TRINITY_DN10793_c0_g3_i2.p1 TRINITY_DN10793_c0_g3~~TRINITY_DN10793_c0_g3_i2.p1  ORF type:complete len:364 (+),score=13.49 TRINITY_DN10793_c0_g3_i2:27-1094(+)
MSRRALEQQQARAYKKQQERLMAGIFTPEPPAQDPPNCFPYKCDRVNMDLGHVLYSNIVENQYFIDRCAELETFEDVVDEIYNHVTHLEPFIDDRNATSTAFCLLYTLFCKRLTEKQLDTLVTHTDSPFIRCIGFLYLRYTTDADTLWTWFSDYLDDPTPVQVQMGHKQSPIPMGMWLRNLLTDLKYYHNQARLPRIPVLKEREIKEELDKMPYDPKRYDPEYGQDQVAPVVPDAPVGRDPRADVRLEDSPPPVGRDSKRSPSYRSRSRSPRRRRDRSRSPRRRRSRSPRRRSRSPRSRRRSRSPRRRRDRSPRPSSKDRYRDTDRRRSRSRSPRRRTRSRSPRRRSRSRSPRRY